MKITLNPRAILPSQDFLKPQTVKFISECIVKGNYDDLPPTPIVRQDDLGRYIAIDGHNLIAVRVFRNENIEVHVAHNDHDGLPEITEENKQRNADLLEKFDAVVQFQKAAESKGIRSFEDLIKSNPDLFNESDAGEIG